MGDVCEIRSGGTPSKAKPEFWGGSIPWISPKDMKFRVVSDSIDHITATAVEEGAARVVPVGSVLVVVRSGILARTIPVARTASTVAVNQDVKALIPHATVQPKYLQYFLESVEPSLLRSITRGATVHRLETPVLQGLHIPVPPLDQQERIVRILEEALKMLQVAKSQVEMARIAGEAIAPSLWDGLTLDVKGYAVATIADVTQIRSGQTLPRSMERSSGDIPYVKVADMNLPANREGIFTSSRFIDVSDVKAAGVVPPGATVFPKRGGAILTNKKRIVRTPIWLDLNMMALIPGPRVEPEYLFLHMLNLDLREINNGSSIPQINNYSIGPQAIRFPTDLEVQKALAQRIMNARARCRALDAIFARKSSVLDELRASLLHQAFTGQL